MATTVLETEFKNPMESAIYNGQVLAYSISDLLELVKVVSNARFMEWSRRGWKGSSDAVNFRSLLRIACGKKSPADYLLRRVAWHWSIHEHRPVLCFVWHGTAISFTAALIIEATQVEIAHVIDGQLTADEAERLNLGIKQLAKSKIMIAKYTGADGFNDALHHAGLQFERPLVFSGFPLPHEAQTLARKSGVRIISPSIYRRWDC